MRRSAFMRMAGVVTVMHVDVAGSTALATRAGDEVAERVLRDTKALVREHAETHGGREIDAVGDAMMLTFPSTRSAIAAAMRVQEALAERERESPGETLRVRVGINVGEVLGHDSQPFGAAINAGARVMALAAGGEILVSELAKRLAGTIPGVRYRDRGRRAFKGFDEPWRIYQIVWDGAPPAPGRRPRMANRRSTAALAAAGVLVLTAGIVVGVTRGGGSHVFVAPDSLVAIDPAANAVRTVIPIGSAPAALAAGDNSLWVANAGDQTLTEVAANGEIVQRKGLARIPSQLAMGAGALWVLSAVGRTGVVSRFDPKLGAFTGTKTVRVGFGAGDDLFAAPTPSAVAVDGSGVWTNDLQARIWHLDRRGGTSTIALDQSESVDGLATGFGSVWIASGSDDSVIRLDPKTHRVTRIAIAAAGARSASPDGIAVGDDAIWVADPLANAVSRIDPKLNTVAATIPVGRRPTRVVVAPDGGGVWSLNVRDGTVTRIDPETNRVAATISVGRDVTAIAAGMGRIWVTVAGGSRTQATSAGRPASLTPLPLSNCGPVEHGAGRPGLLIVSDLPSYADTTQPDPAIVDMRRAALLVLEQHGFRAGRFRLGYQACDDSYPGEGSTTDRCAVNAAAYARDPSVVGVVGAFTSSCTRAELPMLNAAAGGPVAMISPANTYVGLTRAGPTTSADEPERYFPTGTRTYVRLLAPDDYQSAAVVLFLKQLGRRHIYVLDDGQSTGYAGAEYARSAARRDGVTVAGSATWNPAAVDYSRLADRIARAHADAVVLSGCICSNGELLVATLRKRLATRATLIGTDNFGATEAFLGTSTFDGMYSTSAGKPPEDLPSRGRTFLAQLAPRRSLHDIDPAVAYVAQATETLIDAIAASNGTRTSVAHRLMEIRQAHGLTGSIAFDKTGDPVPAAISIYRVDSHLPYTPHTHNQGLSFVEAITPSESLLN